MTRTDKEKAVDAVDILNELMADLVTATMVLKSYFEYNKSGKAPDQIMVPVHKMCVAHIVQMA